MVAILAQHSRVVAAFTYVEHGTQKLFDSLIRRSPCPRTCRRCFWVEILLAFGGLLLLIGLFTRPVAFILSGEMAVIYFLMHAPHGFWPLLNHGEPVVLYCFLFLYVVTVGGGPWSVDRLLRGEANRDDCNPG